MTTTVRGDYLVSLENLSSVTNGDEMMRWMIVGILRSDAVNGFVSNCHGTTAINWIVLEESIKSTVVRFFF